MDSWARCVSVWSGQTEVCQLHLSHHAGLVDATRASLKGRAAPTCSSSIGSLTQEVLTGLGPKLLREPEQPTVFSPAGRADRPDSLVGPGHHSGQGRHSAPGTGARKGQRLAQACEIKFPPWPGTLLRCKYVNSEKMPTGWASSTGGWRVVGWRCSTTVDYDADTGRRGGPPRPPFCTCLEGDPFHDYLLAVPWPRGGGQSRTATTGQPASTARRGAGQ